MEKSPAVLTKWFKELGTSQKTGFTALMLFFLTLTPYLYAKGFTLNLGTLSALSTRIGEFSGLYGFMLYSVTLVLAGRWKFLAEKFSSLKEMYSVHRDLGELTLTVLLLHPLFLAVQYLVVSFQSAAEFLILDLNYVYGQVGLLILVLGIAATIYVNLPYKTWRYTHKVMGAVFLLGFIHAYTVESDIFYSAALNLYFLVFAVAGFGSFLYRSVLGKYLVPRKDYSVNRVEQLNPEMVEIFLEPEDEGMDYSPGDAAFFSFQDDNVPSETHPFSIAHREGRGFSIIVKALGDFTSELKDSVRENMSVKVEGPYSDIEFEGRTQVWVAGGSGIPPFLGKARELDSGDDVHLYYTVSEKSEAVHVEEFRILEKELDGFSFTLHLSDKEGFITADNLEIDGYSNFIFCGPPPMMESLEEQLKQRNVKSESIQAEEFDLR